MNLAWFKNVFLFLEKKIFQRRLLKFRKLPYDQKCFCEDIIYWYSSANALPFIQRGCYSHISGHRKNKPYCILDIATGKNVTLYTSDQPSLPERLKQKRTIVFRITETDNEEARKKLLYLHCKTSKQKQEVDTFIKTYEEEEERNPAMATLTQIQGIYCFDFLHTGVSFYYWFFFADKELQIKLLYETSRLKKLLKANFQFGFHYYFIIQIFRYKPSYYFNDQYGKKAKNSMLNFNELDVFEEKPKTEIFFNPVWKLYGLFCNLKKVEIYFKNEGLYEKLWIISLISSFAGSVRKSLESRGTKTMTTLFHHFQTIDKSGDRLLNKEEIRSALQKFRIQISDRVCKFNLIYFVRGSFIRLWIHYTYSLYYRYQISYRVGEVKSERNSLEFGKQWN